MNYLKIALINFVIEKPIMFKVGLILAGILAGLTDSWFLTKDTMPLSKLGVGILIITSTLIYALILTLYRIIQRVFKFGRSLPEHISKFDEREIVKLIGLYGLIPFGLTMLGVTSSTSADIINLGVILIIQGVSLFLGSWFSQRIKK